jgi:hypothetical protein
VNLVALSEKKIGEIGTVLAGDPSDEGFFHRVMMGGEFKRGLRERLVGRQGDP